MQEQQQESPYDSAGFFSRIFFWWFNRFAFTGLKRKFQESDLCKQPKDEDSDRIGSLFKIKWDEELKKNNPSLLKSIFRVFGCSIFLLCLLNVFQECFVVIIQAYLIGVIIDYFEYKSEEKKLFAYLSAAGFCCCFLLYIINSLSVVFISKKINIRIGIALSNIIYKKGLRLSHASLGKSHIGQMVNLLANDINKIEQFVYGVVYVISTPLQMTIMMLMLWQYLGAAALAVIVIVFLYIPLQIGLGRIIASLRFKTAKLTGKRLHHLNELLATMRIIKMYSWELLFANSVEKIRRNELKSIKKSLFVHGVPFIMGITIIKLLLFFTYFAYFLIGGKLTATVAFVSSSLLMNLYKSVFLLFSQAVGNTVDFLVSIKRIQNFLLLGEKHNTIDAEDSRADINDCGVWVENIRASWNEDSEPTLKNIAFKAEPGDLLLIVGSVGSGKTSLLMTLLGEMPISSGKIILKGKVSYCPQEAWLYNGTIRENILFCNDYDENKYKEVLHISALEKDIIDFPEGDLTIVGEQGRIMSGGQKSRINLARALYHDADIFVLDDPLSAVDAPVGKHIFEKCIKNFIKEKVTILATHQIQFLQSATKIILLKEGQVEAVGDYNNLVKLGINFGLFSDKKKMETDNISDSGQLSFHDKSISTNGNSSRCEQNVNRDIGTTHKKREVKTNESENVDVRETTATGRAIRYKNYVDSGIGRIFQLFLLFFFILTQALNNGSDYWIVKWTNQNVNYVITKNDCGNCTIKTDKNITSKNYIESEGLLYTNNLLNIYVYSGLICGIVLSSLITTVSYFIICSRCSLNIHKRFLHHIIRLPISFFDTNPIGNLLSRFSRDMGIVDRILPISTLFVITSSMNIFGMIVLQSIVLPYLCIPSFILFIIVGILSYLFVGIANDFKHLEGRTSSLIFSHLSTSLYGISTIRAFKTERSFESTFDKHQNIQTSCKFLFMCIMTWSISKIYILCFLNAAIAIVTIFSMSSSITAGEVGLIMSYSLTIMTIYGFLQYQIVFAEGQLISVERILNYCKLSTEASLTSLPDKRPPEDWPQKGNIEFRNVSLQYEGDTQYVLKNLNFSIKPGEKIGIVGRTGAGKSSIVAALFRMVETTGIISIDGIVTKDIGLHDLRNKMSIIPQDPLIFSGSLRRNIDPFDKHDDETLWKVLEEVQLKNAVQNLEGGLDAELSERGSNFSVGQRQLICLARAIIHRNKILILDEATAFIDKETDYIIQKTIREKFASSTILTIAHRLQTIMDSDRIMVLRDGKIEEFDEPYILLQNTNGIFYNMVNKTGKHITKQLHIMAKEMHFEMKNENPKRNEEQTDLKFSDAANIKEYESGNNIMYNGEPSPQHEYFCEETKL